MKLTLVGDLHLRGSSPRSRTDNFPDAQYDKFWQVLALTEPRNDIILQAGDFFDSSSVGNATLNRYIDHLYRCVDHDCGSYLYTVFGQHDMYMWNLKHMHKTSLGTLIYAGLVQLLYEKVSHVPCEDNLELYGASWGQEVPKPAANSKFKVLVVHGSIGDVPLFPGHAIDHPKKFVRKHPGYDLILCGDYHYPFEYRVGDTLIINPGALCRQSLAEKDIVPSVVVYDMESQRAQWHQLEYAKDVFVTNTEVKTEFARTQLEDFVKQLENKDEISISFANNVRIALNTAEVSELAKSKILEVLTQCEMR